MKFKVGDLDKTWDVSKETKVEKVSRLKKELEKAEKDLERPPVVNGHEMVINKNQGKYLLNTIQFGCAVLPNSMLADVIDVNRFINHIQESGLNRKIASITLDSGVSISAEQCEEIVEYYNKNIYNEEN